MKNRIAALSGLMSSHPPLLYTLDLLIVFISALFLIKIFFWTSGTKQAFDLAVSRQQALRPSMHIRNAIEKNEMSRYANGFARG